VTRKISLNPILSNKSVRNAT